ncbi:NADPH-dependent F420 reductase [Curvibacter sp. HBC28]|uniref:NADPH-dependent F420 reductase n=1 Tax=Curvibacter microcysteis TaxID=3026419 RepID=A0ABT5MBB0_9BURK|nr:NADPH-dependent F420 reductase [Curvibacter sp. HBC28]MDD0813194.1 NADPH-dependent F420 reductase [Curvibacter sp. HBC28]
MSTRSTHMKVSLIGTGKMGTGLAAVMAAAGHEVTLGARDITKASMLAASLGRGITGTDIETASQCSEVVILALPYGAVAEVLSQTDGLAGKVVVDISNPITADFQDLLLGHSTSAAEEIQKLLPKARVVKAFNTIFSNLLETSARQDKTLQVFIAGDDADAKATVAELARTARFEPVESGPLRNSRFIEPIGEMNIHFGFFLGRGVGIAPAWVQV